MQAKFSRRLSVAPMMACTDRHDRYLLRLISRRVLLYTEMVPVGAVVHGERDRFLRFSPMEHPVALQLGGSDPAALAEAASAAAEQGYDEINLNVGCPSARVRAGRFGVCLMREPEHVAECVRAMVAAVDVPVTVKCRIGVDELDDYDYLLDFARTVTSAGCAALIVHARKAWLNGISPRANRTIPPLRYDDVYRLRADLPSVPIVLNGGVRTLEAAQAHLERVDGVMIGREAYSNPWLLAQVDSEFYGEQDAGQRSRRDVAKAYAEYMREQVSEGTPPAVMIRHLHGLYQGVAGAREWRRALSPQVSREAKKSVDIADLVAAAVERVECVLSRHCGDRVEGDTGDSGRSNVFSRLAIGVG